MNRDIAQNSPAALQRAFAGLSVHHYSAIQKHLFKGILAMIPSSRLVETDQFAVIVTAIATAYFFLLLASGQTAGVKGAIFWPFLSLSVASQLYHSKARGGLP